MYVILLYMLTYVGADKSTNVLLPFLHEVDVNSRWVT